MRNFKYMCDANSVSIANIREKAKDHNSGSLKFPGKYWL